MHFEWHRFKSTYQLFRLFLQGNLLGNISIFYNLLSLYLYIVIVIAMSGVDDVRPVLDHYREFENPMAAFREKHEYLMVSFWSL